MIFAHYCFIVSTIRPQHLVITEPTSPLQQKLYDRCQPRSEEYPKRDHGWMDDGRNEGVGFSGQISQGPGSTIIWVERACWFCGHVQRAKRKIPAGAGIDGLFPR